MEDFLYYYRGKVTSVYDGDSLTVSIEAGYDLVLEKRKIRLYGLNTPELRGDSRPEGLISRDYLRGLVDGKDVIIDSIKDKTGKYGRYLGRVWFKEGEEWLCANDLLLRDGYAVEYMV